MATNILDLANELLYDIIDRLGDDIVSICNLSRTCKHFQLVADRILARKCRAFRVGDQTGFYREHQPFPAELISYRDIDQVSLGYEFYNSRLAADQTESLLLYLLALCQNRKLTRFPVLAAINYNTTMPSYASSPAERQVALTDNEIAIIAPVLQRLWVSRLKKIEDPNDPSNSTNPSTNSLFFDIQYRQPQPIISAILSLLPNLKVVNYLNESTAARAAWTLPTASMSLAHQPCFQALETLYLNCIQPSKMAADHEEIRHKCDPDSLRDALCLPSLKVLKAQHIGGFTGSLPGFKLVMRSPITALELEHSDVPAKFLAALFSRMRSLRRFVYRHDKGGLHGDILGFDLKGLNTALDHVANTLEELEIDFKAAVTGDGSAFRLARVTNPPNNQNNLNLNNPNNIGPNIQSQLISAFGPAFATAFLTNPPLPYPLNNANLPQPQLQLPPLNSNPPSHFLINTALNPANHHQLPPAFLNPPFPPTLTLPRLPPSNPPPPRNRSSTRDNPTLIGSLGKLQSLHHLSIPWYILLSPSECNNNETLAARLPFSLRSLTLLHHTPPNGNESESSANADEKSEEEKEWEVERVCMAASVAHLAEWKDDRESVMRPFPVLERVCVGVDFEGEGGGKGEGSEVGGGGNVGGNGEGSSSSSASTSGSDSVHGSASEDNEGNRKPEVWSWIQEACALKGIELIFESRETIDKRNGYGSGSVSAGEKMGAPHGPYV